MSKAGGREVRNVQWLGAMSCEPTLDHGAVRIALAIGQLVGRPEELLPDANGNDALVTTISDLLVIEPERVDAALRHLEQMGWISIVTTKVGGQYQRAYTLLVPHKGADPARPYRTILN